jgi:hypothetical protein
VYDRRSGAGPDNLPVRTTTVVNRRYKESGEASLDTRLRGRLSPRPHMNLSGTTISSRFAHVSVVAVSVVVVSAVVMPAPRGF